MSCEELQKSFSPYLDDLLPPPARAGLEEHLRLCPVCRARMEAERAVVRGLALAERPAPPPDLIASINDAILIERAARLQRPPTPPSVRFARWLRPRVLPYTVGALASLLLFVAISSALRPQLRLLRELAQAQSGETPPVYLISGGYNVMEPISLAGYAASRANISSESPSLNPGGALAKLVRTPTYGTNQDDDDTVIVADVFSNGSATLAEVVQPPRNRRMLEEVQEAFRRTPAFVPASLDKRPQTMRVVLSLSKVNVHERGY